MTDITAPRRLDDSSRRLLEAYAASTAVLLATNPEHDGRIDRLHDVDGLTDDELPMLHGQLLAAGLIEFDLNDRDGGVYSITSEGKRLLSKTSEAESESDAA
ncbi:hypothetical protein [Stratiformator vulcanicus]|nr:hypothetical protein [Stratiformator vulcanicus]